MFLVPLLTAACTEPTKPAAEPDTEGEVDEGDPNRLLTDEELRTPEDPNAPPANPEWVGWLDEHHHPIRSLYSDDFSDLRFLEPLLRDKRVVQLGESAHGVGEYNLLKVRLIRYLHEELGFELLAFESSIYECSTADALTDGSEMLEQCLFPVWHTAEVLPLFDWMATQRASGDPKLLRLTGFDSQVSSLAGIGDRPRRLEDAARIAAGPSYARAVADMDDAFIANYGRGSTAFEGWLAVHADSLKTAYARLADTLEAGRTALEAAYPEEPEWPVVAARTARSMTAFIEQRSLPSGSAARVVVRAEAMAQNLEALLDAHNGKKAIVWGHNFHLRHDNARIPEYGMPTMGTWLSESLEDDLYTIGFYMYRGFAALNNRSIYRLERPPANSLENVAYHIRKRHLFFDVRGAERTSGIEWLFTPVVTHTWGISEVTLVVREQYDGILFVDMVGPPAYLW